MRKQLLSLRVFGAAAAQHRGETFSLIILDWGFPFGKILINRTEVSNEQQ